MIVLIILLILFAIYVAYRLRVNAASRAKKPPATVPGPIGQNPVDDRPDRPDPLRR